MPFGAEIVDGGVRFRLWAPSARAVALVLHGSADTEASSRTECTEAGARSHGPAVQPIEMSAQPDGWYEVITPAAHAGTRYKFRINGEIDVPDPAARAVDDATGDSIVVDPTSYVWHDHAWRGRPWHEAAIYELHVGTFSPEGTFKGVRSRLDHLVQLGITMIELMPVADFPGRRGWGYDGVLLYAPDAAYGSPEDLKALIDAAHQRGLAVLLDVVYNHFGPEGNWLHTYAKPFFTERHKTPWGAGINFDGEGSRYVRDFFIQNALYWLEEYHFDGLRIDAVHAMQDDSPQHFIPTLRRAIHEGTGEDREIHVVLENGDNTAHFLGPPGERDLCEAQWNDDLHHCLHVILTGETDGYYEDYGRPHAMLCRSLAEGFVYQGEVSRHHASTPRGEPSAHLPPTAFVNFLQNHDQIGNRAFGERLSTLVQNEAALLAATSVVLLAPSPPLLFMGEEWAAAEPFVYFCDFEPELAAKVREGRKREFARFERFRATGAQEPPDPTMPETFESARLDWAKLSEPLHARWLERYQRLLAIRQRDIVPIIPHIRSGRCIHLDGNGAFAVDWPAGEGSMLHLICNLTDHPVPIVGRPAGRIIYATHPNIRDAVRRNTLDPWCVTWFFERARGDG
jgi:maltooligosyltrehalose trehalohydrolase